MHTDEHAYDFENQKSVLFIIGVNGVGKTTSVGKLASIYKNKGKKVLVAAADTYRAAATEQLEEWTNRAGVVYKDIDYYTRYNDKGNGDPYTSLVKQ